MDLQLEQWRNQHESEPQQRSPSMPKFLLQHPPPPASLTLPLFLPQPYPIVTTLTLPSAPPRFIRMESCFSFAQWQELELQALIFRYMLAGVPVPPQLLQPIKKTLFHSSLPFLQHYHPALFESGYYWGREPEEDPEPGRCRRTDGKKWRCSREAVEGQKYCERHMHRGRNRSRKRVEKRDASSSSSSATFKHQLLHLNKSSSGGKSESRNSSENHDHDWDDRSSVHVLRHFFDDWPNTVQEPDHAGRNDSQNNNTGTALSMSTPGITSSDVSLKLFTGHAEDTCHVTSVGGPLAEALRSSTSTPSPTSVLLQLPTSSACETSLIST